MNPISKRGLSLQVGRSLKVRKMPFLTAGLLSLALAFPTLEAPVAAHGGGLDSSGGHNCYVPACAGEYHCHRPWMGCGRNSNRPVPTPSATQPVSKPSPPLVVARCVRPVSGANYSKGEIALTQAVLKFLGYSPGPIDGIYGSQTRSALHLFEDRHQLPLSGRLVLSWETVKKMSIDC